MTRTLILGVGNVLLSDEGVGVHVARRMMQMDLPPDVVVVDGGTVGLDLLPHFHDMELVILIDALQADDQPGTIYRLAPENLAFSQHPALSVHEMGILEMIRGARLLGFHPQIQVFGIVAKNNQTCSLELSPEVESAVPKVIQIIIHEITRAPALCGWYDERIESLEFDGAARITRRQWLPRR
jgi:hydrogenase maturation protease